MTVEAKSLSFENIKICENIAIHGPFADSVVFSIGKSTTQRDFDQILVDYFNRRGTEFNLAEGAGCHDFTAVHIAAHVGNSELIRHIVQKGGSFLVNVGNFQGITALYSTCCNYDGPFQLEAAKTLLELGADPNLGLEKNFDIHLNAFNGTDGPRERGKTPLWEAAEKTQNFALVKLLLQNGAIESDKLKFSPAAKALIQSVREQIEEEKVKRRLLLSAYLKEENQSEIKRLPAELMCLILQYLKD